MKKSIVLSNREMTINLDEEKLHKLSRDESKLRILLLRHNIKWKMLHSVNKINRLPHFLFSLKDLGCVYLTEDVEWHIELKDGSYINTNNIEDILNFL